MKHEIRTIWITAISMIAMLMSTYVSSAPQMDFMTSEHSMHTLQQSSVQANSGQLDCHSTNAVTQTSNFGSLDSQCQHQNSQAHAHSSHNAHSCSQGEGVHNCCTSVCSSVSYPLLVKSDMLIPSHTLALHQFLTIGETSNRPNLFLRPPSA
jgi:hypothetical protein